MIWIALFRVILPETCQGIAKIADRVDDLMGKKPEKRFEFIRDNADMAGELDV